MPVPLGLPTSTAQVPVHQFEQHEGSEMAVDPAPNNAPPLCPELTIKTPTEVNSLSHICFIRVWIGLIIVPPLEVSQPFFSSEVVMDDCFVYIDENEFDIARRFPHGSVKMEPGDDLLEKSKKLDSGFAGIYSNPPGWAAHVRLNGFNHFIGQFSTPIEAARGRRDEIKRLDSTDDASQDGPRLPASYHTSAPASKLSTKGSGETIAENRSTYAMEEVVVR